MKIKEENLKKNDPLFRYELQDDGKIESCTIYLTGVEQEGEEIKLYYNTGIRQSVLESELNKVIGTVLVSKWAWFGEAIKERFVAGLCDQKNEYERRIGDLDELIEKVRKG